MRLGRITCSACPAITLKFYDGMSKSQIAIVDTDARGHRGLCRRGYVRCKGIGTLAVTYDFGVLNVVDAVAGARAETRPRSLGE